MVSIAVHVLIIWSIGAATVAIAIAELAAGQSIVGAVISTSAWVKGVSNPVQIVKSCLVQSLFNSVTVQFGFIICL